MSQASAQDQTGATSFTSHQWPPVPQAAAQQQTGPTAATSQQWTPSEPHSQPAPYLQSQGGTSGYGGYSTSIATQWGSHSSLSSSQWEAPAASQLQVITLQAYPAQAAVAESHPPAATQSQSSNWGQALQPPAVPGFWQPATPAHQAGPPTAATVNTLPKTSFWQPVAVASTAAAAQPPSAAYWQPGAQAGDALQHAPQLRGHGSSHSWSGNNSAIGSQWGPSRGLGTIYSGDPLQDAVGQPDVSGPLTTRIEQPDGAQPPGWQYGDDNDGADFFAEASRTAVEGTPSQTEGSHSTAVADETLPSTEYTEAEQGQADSSIPDPPLHQQTQHQQPTVVGDDFRNHFGTDAPAASLAEEWTTPFAAPASQVQQALLSSCSAAFTT